MTLGYYQIRSKEVWKVHGAWIDGYFSQNKDKSITITKIKSLFFFHVVYYSKKHVIPHSVIAAILIVILNILQRRKKQTITCKSKSPNTTENYQI